MDEQHPDEPSLIDCAWCARWFDSVLELLDHVEEQHLAEFSDAA
jgi:hypothetical protein